MVDEEEKDQQVDSIKVPQRITLDQFPRGALGTPESFPIGVTPQNCLDLVATDLFLEECEFQGTYSSLIQAGRVGSRSLKRHRCLMLGIKAHLESCEHERGKVMKTGMGRVLTVSSSDYSIYHSEPFIPHIRFTPHGLDRQTHTQNMFLSG